MSAPTVLVVDDSLTVRMDLTEALREAGFEAVPCATLEAAREALASAPCQLVVLDVMLPDGDGLELLRELKAAPATAQMPVVLLSSESEVRDRVRGMRRGADEYVGKPYDLGYLVARTRELVQGAVATGPRAARTSVLLIEDSVTFREHLRSLLEAAGYAVATASSGEEGLRVAAHWRPDLLVVDGVLPGIDGPTVLRRLRADAALRRTPCVLLTAAEGAVDELQALDAGADAYVRKSDGPQVVLARLASLSRARRADVAEPAPSLSSPKRVLAVDDSPTFLLAAAAELRGEGYEVVLARSGDEALELLAVQSVDCILMDLQMPGLSGHEACRLIKATPGLRDVPLVILTASEDSGSLVDGINAGADDYISKSGDFGVLKARLRAQLRRKQFEDETRGIREQLVQKEVEALEARAERALAETRARLLADLEEKNRELAHANRELESFAYSVSHDLRAPLRSIRGFSRAVLEDHSAQLDAEGRDYLDRVCKASDRMGELIEGLLALAHVARDQLLRGSVDLSALALSVGGQLAAAHPGRAVELTVAPEARVDGDPRLLRVVLDNLLGNAWKFTAPVAAARVEFGALDEHSGRRTFFVRDNGVGFDSRYAERLFQVFQRLHSATEFEGTGIGLATVQRVVERHGGRVWAECTPLTGTTFYFTLPVP